MRFISCFFFVLGQTTLFLTPTANLSLHLVVLVDLRENQAKLLLGDLIVGQCGRDPVSDCLALRRPGPGFGHVSELWLQASDK